VPGDQVPGDRADHAGEDHAEAGDAYRELDQAVADRLGHRRAEVRADEVADRGHREGDAGGEGAGADAGGDGVRRVVKTVRVVEGYRGDDHRDRGDELGRQGLGFLDRDGLDRVRHVFEGVAGGLELVRDL